MCRSPPCPTANTIHELVLAAANGEPGAAELPIYFSSYPKTVMALPDDSILVDYQDYFSEEELSAFIPASWKKGMVNDRLVVLPVAKSQRSCSSTRPSLTVFSGNRGDAGGSGYLGRAFKAAEVYADWTDAQTPDIPDDAKSMFVHDYYFTTSRWGRNPWARISSRVTGWPLAPLSRRRGSHWRRPRFRAASCSRAVYATESIRTGDSIVSVASSASSLYYSDVVTYPDNTSEEITIISRPCPVFEAGENLVMQRGVGFCTVRSTPEREQAAVTFLKWLTEPERNVEFVTRAGYMPVTREAFENELPKPLRDWRAPSTRLSIRRIWIPRQTTNSMCRPNWRPT